MRVLTALLLSLVLALGSVSMAVARGQAPMAGTVSLCTDAGVVTLALDARGNPLPHGPHLCPDCLGAASVFALPDQSSLTPPRSAASAVTRPAPPAAGAGLTRITAHARGPPLPSV